MQNICGEGAFGNSNKQGTTRCVSKTKISHMMGSMAGDEFREARQEVNQFNLLQLSETRNLSDFLYLLVQVQPLAFSQEISRSCILISHT